MATWEDGPEYAPLERPDAFAEPSVATVGLRGPAPAAERAAGTRGAPGVRRSRRSRCRRTRRPWCPSRRRSGIPNVPFDVAASLMTAETSAWASAHWPRPRPGRPRPVSSRRPPHRQPLRTRRPVRDTGPTRAVAPPTSRPWSTVSDPPVSPRTAADHRAGLDPVRFGRDPPRATRHPPAPVYRPRAIRRRPTRHRPSPAGYSPVPNRAGRARPAVPAARVRPPGQRTVRRPRHSAVVRAGRLPASAGPPAHGADRANGAGRGHPRGAAHLGGRRLHLGAGAGHVVVAFVLSGRMPTAARSPGPPSPPCWPSSVWSVCCR